MKFGHPGWLVAIPPACALLAWLWHRHDLRQRAALARFVSSHLRDALTQSLSVARRRLRRGLFLASVVLLLVALAGPLVGFHWELISRRGNEIVFAIDTSRSMATPDIKPNRLARAKLAIDDFANRLDGDAVGIVAFAGTAFLVCPITLDYGAFHEALGAIDTNTIPLGGTNIASAIREAEAALQRRPGSDKILILVTDGEDLEGSALAAAEAAARQGLRIFTVGVGTPGGDLIPVPADQGGGFVKDDTGAFVKSRLDEPALRAIAAAAGGFYEPLGPQGEGLDTIFAKVLGSLAKHDLASRQQKVYIERYQWPLAASLGALLASLLVGTRRRGGARRPATATLPAAKALLIAGALALALTGARTTHAAGAEPTLEYNAGTAAYRAGQFPQAAQAFQRAISHSPSSDPRRLADQEDAYYDLGNTLYRTGQKTEKSDPKDTLQKWNDAVKAYETALQLRANDADSKYNRDFVKRKIAALQQQQDQDKNKNKDKGKGQGQGQGQGKGQGQGQGQPPNSPPKGGQPPPPPQPNPNGSKGDQPPPGGGQPPPGAGQPPPPGSGGAQPPPGEQPNGQPKGQPNGQPGAQPPDQDAQANREAQAADNDRQPGQMSREEARELLDSVKGDERHALGAPLDRRDAENPPDKPIKNW